MHSDIYTTSKWQAWDFYYVPGTETEEWADPHHGEQLQSGPEICKEGNGNGSFIGPHSIAMDNKGVLYVADSQNRLIQKFSDNGEFISQFCVNDNDNECTTLNMALDQNNGLIYCIETGYKNYAFHPRQMMLVFNLEGQLQHSYKLSNCTSPYFIAINTEQDIIISDTVKKSLCKFDKQGKYLNCMGDLKYPAFITIGEDDSIIVTDTNNDSICVFNPDGKFRHKFGTSGTGKGQLESPYGVATDGQLILEADMGNNRIQVFRCNGTFVSMIESKGDPLNMPCGLLITGDGYVCVADMNNNCIKKYKYKWLTQFPTIISKMVWAGNLFSVSDTTN